MAYDANVFPTFIVAELSPQTQANFSRYDRMAAQSGERARRAFEQGADGAAGVARQLRLAAAGAGAFQGALNGISSRLNAIAGIFTGAGFGAGIATTLAAAAAGFVTTGARVQQYQALLRAAVGSEEAFQAAQEATARIAKDTRSSLDDTIRAYARLAVTAGDVGLQGADLERVLATVQKAMQLSGAGTQEAAAAMQQFSQAIGSGKLAGDELRSILENAPKLGQYIAQGLNAQGLVEGVQVTIGNMRDLAAEGQITADKVVKALLYMSNTADRDFSQMGVTVGQATTQVKNALSQLVISVEDTFGVLSGTATVINAVAENMNVLGLAAVALGARFMFTTAVDGLKAFALANTKALVAARLLMTISPGIGTLTVAMGGLRAAAAGVLAIFGGPWVVAVTAAAGGLFYLATRASLAEEAANRLGMSYDELRKKIRLAGDEGRKTGSVLADNALFEKQEALSDQRGDARQAKSTLVSRIRQFGTVVGSSQRDDSAAARQEIEGIAISVDRGATTVEKAFARLKQIAGTNRNLTKAFDGLLRKPSEDAIATSVAVKGLTKQVEDLQRKASGAPPAVSNGAIGDGRSVAQIKADAEVAADAMATAQKRIQNEYRKALTDIDARFLDKGKLKDPKLAGEYEAALTEAARRRNEQLAALTEQKAAARETARELRQAETEASQLGDAIGRAMERYDSEPAFFDRIQADIAALEEARRRLDASGKNSITLGDKSFSREDIDEGIANAEAAKLKPIREATREMEDQLAVGKLILEGREADAEILAADLATLRQYGIEQSKIPPEVERELAGRRKVLALVIEQQRRIREAQVLRDSRQDIAEMQLVLAGREDEAEVQRRIYSITQGIYTLDEDKVKVIRAQVAESHNLSRELERQRQIIDAQVEAAYEVQDAFRNGIRGVLDGKIGSSVKNLGKQLADTFKDLQANQLSIRLFGDLGADVRDALTRASGPMGEASVSFKNATQTFETAVNTFANATGAQPTAAQVATTPTAFGGSGGVGGTLGMIGSLIGGPIGTIAGIAGRIFGGRRTSDGLSDSVARAAESGATAGRVDAKTGNAVGVISAATVQFIDAAGAQTEAAKAFGMSVKQYEDNVKAARAGDPSALYNLNFGRIGTQLDQVLGTKGLGKLGAQVGEVLGTALESAEFGKGVTNALGIRGSKTGAAIGGTIGKAVGGPIGEMIGSVLGSVAGGLLKSAKQASTTISFAGGRLTETEARDNNTGKFDAAISGLTGSIVDALERITDAVGGTLTGAAGVSVGVRDGQFRVDTLGQGNTKKSTPGVVDFDKDAEAAAKFAIQTAIEKGVIEGLRESTKRLLTAGGDFERAVDNAAKFEDVFKQLEQMKDPTGFAIKQLDAEFTKLRAIFAEAAATSAEYAQLEELYTLKRQEILDKAAGAAGNLAEMLADVQRQIDEIENPTRAALTDITKKFEELKTSLTKAGASAADLAQAEKLFALQREQLKEQAGVADLDGQIKAILDPMGFALDQLDERFATMRQALETLGGTAEEFAKLDQLYALERAEAIKDATKQTVSALQGFLDSLKTSESSGLSLSTRRTNAIAAFNPLAAQVAAGQVVDEDAFIKAAQTLLEIERELFGSTKGYFDRLTQITALTEKALGQQGTATPSAANDNATQAALLAAQAAAQVANQPTGTQVSGLTAPPNPTTAAAAATQAATTAMTQALRATFTPQPSAPVFDVRPVVNAIGDQTRQLGQRLDRLIEQQDSALSLNSRRQPPTDSSTGIIGRRMLRPAGNY